jgi:hypothetical protein
MRDAGDLMAARQKIIDKDRGWKRIKAEIDRTRRKPHVRVGIFGAKAAADHGGTPNVVVATAHELGTSTVPERSYIRATVDQKRTQIAGLARRLAAAVVAGRLSRKHALDLLGQFVRGEMQQRISDGIPPPLKPETIARKTVRGKKGTTPLIRTGQLRSSIDYQTKNT